MGVGVGMQKESPPHVQVGLGFRKLISKPQNLSYHLLFGDMPDRSIFVCLGPWITMDIGWKLWAKTIHNTTTGGFGFTQDQSNWSWRSPLCSIIHASVLEPQCKFWKLRLGHNPGWQSSLPDVTHCIWEGLMSVGSTGRE